MVEHRTLRLDGREYTVTISDEREALSAAAAAGMAIVGVINKELPDQDLSPCTYAVERAEDIDEEFLMGVLRRRLGLPWVIARTKRLTIREFTASDPLCVELVDGENGRVFMDRELLAAYIGNQYRVFGYGIWALEETATGEIVGKAGLSDRGLGYHIYAPHRRKGYACEACRAIIDYARDVLGFETLEIETDASNEASVKTALALGFMPQSDQSTGNSSEIHTSSRRIRYVRSL